MKIKTFMPFAFAAIIVGIAAIFGFSKVAHAETFNVNLNAVEAGNLQHRIDAETRVTSTNPSEIVDPTGWVVVNPSIATNQASHVTDSTVQLNGYFDQGNSLWDTAIVHFEYGTSATNMQYGTSPHTQTLSEHIVASYIQGLTPNTKYYYKAVMQYQGKTTYGSTVSFTTSSATSTSSGSTTGSTTGNSSSSNTGSNSNTGSSNSNTGSNSSSNTGSSSSTSTHSNGTATNSFVTLSITDNETKIARGDTVTYKVTYKAKQAMKNAELVIELPNGMTITDASRGKVNKSDASVTVDLNDLDAGDTRTIEIDARLNKNYRDGADLSATAKLSFETVSGSERSITATDTTEFSGDSSLGASIFGTGVSINLFQWILIAGILAAIIILARKQFAKKA